MDQSNDKTGEHRTAKNCLLYRMISRVPSIYSGIGGDAAETIDLEFINQLHQKHPTIDILQFTKSTFLGSSQCMEISKFNMWWLISVRRTFAVGQPRSIALIRCFQPLNIQPA